MTVTDDMKQVAKWAKEHKTEINFSENGEISLFAEAGNVHVTIDEIKLNNITAAIFALEAFRDAGWVAN